MSDLSDEREALVDAYLRHLLEGEAPPDLTGMGDDARAALERTFAMLEAVAGIDPDLVPESADDPVAQALGFGPAPAVVVAPAGPAGPPGDVAGRIAGEIGSLRRGAVVLPDEEAALLPGTRSDLLVRAGGVRIRVAIVGADELAGPDELLAEADRLFWRFPETAAVALVVDDDDLSCQIVEAQDCRPAVETPLGRRAGPRPRRPQLPLALALRSYLDDVEPVWEEPEAIADAADRPFDVESAAAELAAAVVRRLKDEASRARIPAKRAAFAALGDREIEGLVRLVADVSRGRVAGSGVGARIALLVGDAA